MTGKPKETPKLSLSLTRLDLEAIMNIVDECSASIGMSDGDTSRLKWVKRIDVMLKKNGYKRKYN